jgi:hypothetical protein
MEREDFYVTEVQEAARQGWSGINKLLMLQREWTFRDYTNTLGAGITLTSHPTVAELSAVVNTSTTALDAVLAAGHGTNITAVL